MTDEKPLILAQYPTISRVAAAVNAARFRAEAEQRKLDEVLDRVADADDAADQGDGDPVRAGEDRRPLVPGDLLIGLLIGVLAVLVLIAILALLPS
jgi:hypothetical protein